VNPSQADVQLFVNELDKTSTTISRLQKVCIAFQEAIRTPSLSVFLDEIPVQSSQSSHQKPCQGHGSSKSLFEDSMKNILSTRYPRISLGLLNALLKATCARKRFFQYLASQRLRTTEADARPNNLSKQELVGSRSRQQDSSGSYSRGSRGPSFHEDISNFKLNKSPVLSASLAGLEYSGAERFPEPPVVKEDSEELECPYCFWRMPREVFSTPELWRKHVEDDLQPYQCLHPECLHLTKLFTSRIDWIKHQQDDHPTMLICPICPDVEPSPLTRDHYASSHNITLSSSQFRTLSKRAEKSKVCSTLEACPFCEYCEAEPKSQYLVHGIADHLLEISILCISAETQTEGNESLGFPMANVTSEGIKKNLSTKPQIEGRDSRPPLSMQNIARIVNLFEGINEPYYESHTDNHIFGGSPDMIRLSTKKGAGDTASRNRGTETTNPSSVDVVLSETLPHNQPYYSSTGQRPPAPATKDNVHWIWNEKEQDHYYTSIDPQGKKTCPRMKILILGN
jgi:hypothetical protein